MTEPKASRKDKLFELVKSLTRTEKRYFKVHFGNREDAFYLTLFETLLNLEHYDEAKVKKLLCNHAATRNFHVAKKYLFNLIMRSLISYHRGCSTDFDLKEILQQIEICNQKGLFHIAFRLLRRAEKMAAQHQRPLALLEIYSLQKQNLQDLVHFGYKEEDVKQILAKEKRALEQAENLAYYKSVLTGLLSEYVRWEGIRKPEQNLVFQKIEKDTMFSDSSKCLSEEALLYFQTIWGYYNFENGRFARSLKNRKAVVAILEKKTDQSSKTIRMLLVTRFNLINDLRMLSKFEEANQILLKLEQTEVFSPAMEAEKFRRSFIQKTQLALDTGSYHLFPSFEQDFYRQLPRHEKAIGAQVKRMIETNLARGYFGSRNYSHCLTILNNLVSQPKKDQETGTLTFAKILMILAQFESGNKELVEHLTRSAIHYCKKHKVLHETESAVLNFFLRLSTGKKFSFQSESKELLNFLENKTQPKDRKTMLYQDITLWLKSKIREGPVAGQFKTTL